MSDDCLGPEESLSQLRGWLCRYAAVLLDGRLRGNLDASDVVQDTLLKAFAAREQLRGRSEAERRAWLRRILANTLADVVRQFLGGQKRNVGQECSLDDAVRHSSERLAGWLADGRPLPQEQAEKEERLLGLAEAMAELPDDQREAIRLRRLQGLSVGEVAARMGRTPAAVAGLLRRGLEAVRQRLGGDGP